LQTAARVLIDFLLEALGALVSHTKFRHQTTHLHRRHSAVHVQLHLRLSRRRQPMVAAHHQRHFRRKSTQLQVMKKINMCSLQSSVQWMIFASHMNSGAHHHQRLSSDEENMQNDDSLSDDLSLSTPIFN
jgi:hypothetical protein